MRGVQVTEQQWSYRMEESGKPDVKVIDINKAPLEFLGE